MFKDFPLIPEQASTYAAKLDLLFWAQTAFTLGLSLLIFIVIFFFTVRYRRSKSPKATPIHGHVGLEILWTAIPFAISVVLLVWSVSLFVTNARPPTDASGDFGGGQAVDVETPAPDGPAGDQRASRPGRAHGEAHHGHRGRHSQLLRPGVPGEAGRRPGPLHHPVVRGDEGGRVPPLLRRVLRNGPLRHGRHRVRHGAADYESWLSGGELGGDARRRGGEALRAAGARAATRWRPGAGPRSGGSWARGSLASGETVIADEAYIRESILNPRAKLVEGYSALMPTFAGQVTEESLLQLIAYIKSLSPAARRKQSDDHDERLPRSTI